MGLLVPWAIWCGFRVVTSGRAWGAQDTLHSARTPLLWDVNATNHHRATGATFRPARTLHAELPSKSNRVVTKERLPTEDTRAGPRTAHTEQSEAMESHGKLVQVSAQAAFQFHLVFSNKTESDVYCLEIWSKLNARGVQTWYARFSALLSSALCLQ